MSTQLPPHLFKYQAFAPHSLANIRQASIWFSAPSRFNDPFDCALSIVKTDLSDPDFRRAFEYVRRAGRMAPELEAEMYRNGEPTTRFREITVESIKKVFEERRAIQSHHRGVACFSAKSDDLLMWSHYSDGHRGFCLEFDTSLAPFSKAKPVIYRDDVPSANPIRWQVSQVHRERLRAIDLEGFRLHDARHHWAVRMARAGAPFELVARQLGHRDVTMVAKVYGRFKPDTEERDRWERLATARDAEKWGLHGAPGGAPEIAEPETT